MMRSLFSGVSGLKNHQTRMDVIGNNISNVNTTGYKSSRVNFTDILSQNLTGASAPNDNIGGTNPKQIGLGSAVGAVDLLFTNGSVQSTGVNTDLALSSTNALFILNTGSGTAYTRNGDFQFDADGNYVQAGNGYFVQGWMANNGTIDTGSQVSNITIPSGKSMAPVASSMAVYSNNLNAEVPTITEITGGTVLEEGTKIYTLAAEGSMTASEKYKMNITVGGTDTFPGLTSGTYTVGQNFEIGKNCPIETGSMSGSTAYPVSITAGNGNGFSRTAGTFTIGNTFETTEDGDSMTGSSTYPVNVTVGGSTLFVMPKGNYTVGGTFTSTTAGETLTASGTYHVTVKAGGSSFEVDSGNYTVETGTYTTNVTGKQMTASAAAQVTIIDEDGDPHVVTSGTYAVGGTYGGKEIKSLTSKITSVSQQITKLGAEITNLGRSITQMEQKYAKTVSASADNPATVKLSDGSTVIQTSGNYTVENSLPIVTTLSVYDTLGSVHELPVYFTLTSASEDTWSVALSNDGTNSTSWKEADGSITTVTMDSATLDFDTNGAFSAGTGKPTLTLTNGSTTPQSITLDFTQMPQYSSSSTIAGKADGNAAGTLSSVSIDKTGTITGTYTNGMKQVEAQVALQRFNNPGGLTKVGESLYEDSNNAGRSGEPSTASTLGATITPAALEMSNVDIANEFTDMIITQRGFQGNSKIITVSDEMLETLINLKR